MHNTQWNWLVYMGADNDLDSDVQGDLSEMEKADPSKVQVVVQVDHFDEPTERFQLIHGNGLQKLPSINNKDDFDANSENPIVVSSFLRFAQHLAPSARTAVILWSHGAGFEDFTFEGATGPAATKLKTIRRNGRMIKTSDHSASRFLSNPSLGRALAIACQDYPFDVIGSDSCLMAMLEVAHQIRRCGTIFVASQSNIRRTGWNYEDILKQFTDAHTPEEVAGFIVDVGRHQGDATISAIRLDRMDDVASKLNELGDVLLPLLGTEQTAIRRARDQVRTFPRLGFIDLYDFAERLREEFDSAKGDGRAVGEATDALMKAVRRAIIRPTPAEVDRHSNGLTVYVPTLKIDEAKKRFESLSLTHAAPRWAAFVRAHSEL